MPATGRFVYLDHICQHFWLKARAGPRSNQIQRHDVYSANTPPKTGPIAPEIAQTMSQIPKYSVLRLMSNISLMTILTSSMIPPAAAPWRARPAISIPMLVASPQTNDATMKKATDANRTTFRPLKQWGIVSKCFRWCNRRELSKCPRSLSIQALMQCHQGDMLRQPMCIQWLN